MVKNALCYTKLILKIDKYCIAGNFHHNAQKVKEEIGNFL